jgi:hypothetical protein
MSAAFSFNRVVGVWRPVVGRDAKFAANHQAPDANH